VTVVPDHDDRHVGVRRAVGEDLPHVLGALDLRAGDLGDDVPVAQAEQACDRSGSDVWTSSPTPESIPGVARSFGARGR
jgi:hypothetical protein